MRDSNPHGPLPQLMLVLTVVTGLVDAVSYLKLDRVFVANMTGNVVFLGFSAAGAPGLSFAASLVAIVAFLAGSVAGGRLGVVYARDRGRLLGVAAVAKVVLVGSAAGVAAVAGDHLESELKYAIIVLLGLAMGLQNATARRLSVTDLTTTVLTMTLTGIAADSSLAGGKNPRLWRRIAAVLTMVAGAFMGGLLVLHVPHGSALALSLAALLLAFTATSAYVRSRGAPAWVSPATA